MLKLYIRIMDLLRSERGQDMVEYALITVVVSLAIVFAVIGILQGSFQTWANNLSDCIGGGGPGTCPLP